MICDKCGKLELTYQKTSNGNIFCLNCCEEVKTEYIDNYDEYQLNYLIKNDLQQALLIYLETKADDERRRTTEP